MREFALPIKKESACGTLFEAVLRETKVAFYVSRKGELIMQQLKLIFPALEMEKQAIDYRQEHFDCGEHEIHGDGGLDHAVDYSEWIDNITAGLTIDDGNLVPATTYFAFVDDRIVGTLQIRNKLNDFLLGYGGHIGYGVRPSARRKGYATKMLALALEKCRELGIEKALITCDRDNLGSARTIIKNGGVLENEVAREGGSVTQRYWINVSLIKTKQR